MLIDDDVTFKQARDQYYGVISPFGLKTQSRIALEQNVMYAEHLAAQTGHDLTDVRVAKFLAKTKEEVTRKFFKWAEKAELPPIPNVKETALKEALESRKWFLVNSREYVSSREHPFNRELRSCVLTRLQDNQVYVFGTVNISWHSAYHVRFPVDRTKTPYVLASARGGYGGFHPHARGYDADNFGWQHLCLAYASEAYFSSGLSDQAAVVYHVLTEFDSTYDETNNKGVYPHPSKFEEKRIKHVEERLSNELRTK